MSKFIWVKEQPTDKSRERLVRTDHIVEIYSIDDGKHCLVRVEEGNDYYVYYVEGSPLDVRADVENLL